ncbi:WhiB family transcriptional regulator [Nonomuraea typhae]|uniref:WhiB family transcriptional regulator n=1 Tax=Nonomuraea typhae TaxID=2603600 RepID=UPI0012F772FB|nr:WhiB family transcriptional regulator [Nonomuraea typhae]
MPVNMNLLPHPSRLTLADLEAGWSSGGDPPALPECTYDPELHTGPRSRLETDEQRAAREHVAREVCATCPARSLCLPYAVNARPTSGIWAGHTADAIPPHLEVSHPAGYDASGDLPDVA